MDITDNLFIPPLGLPRPIPTEKQAEYYGKYKALGPFTRHEYDMDICTIYRQMDDLKATYKTFNNAPFENYVAQIKINVSLNLKEMKLDEEFYLNNFYCVLKADSKFYFSYLGLFLALSDPLRITPILEHHLDDFLFYDEEKQGPEYFLGKLEYLVCNFLRTNRFPQDFFAKHDKIINWVYSRQNLLAYQNQVDRKLESILNAFNKISPRKVASEVFRKVEPINGAQRKSNAVIIESERVETLYEDIKSYFNEQSHKALKEILSGNATPALKIIFQGYANQLCDVFRIYSKEEYITGTKRGLALWICEHFMYLIDSTRTSADFDQGAVENVLYGQDLPPKGPKRIKLSGLPKEQHTYYPKKEKR